jgi:hypothetical protein
MSETTLPVRTPQDQFVTLATGRIPWFASCTPEQAAALYADYVRAADQEQAEDYVAAAADFATYADLASNFATAEQAAAPAAEAAAQVQAAQAEAEATEAAAREAANKVLLSVVKHYRQGESAYRKGLLEAGRLAHEYVLLRLALQDKRDAATQAIEGKLAEWSSGRVDANELIRAHQSYALLALPLLKRTEAEAEAAQAAKAAALSPEERKAAKAAALAAEAAQAAVDAVPYGFYRDAYCQLVQRVDGGKPSERWELLPGLETEALALFERCTADRLSKGAVLVKVRELQARYATRQREQEAKAAAEAKRAREEANERAAAEREANRLACEQAAREQKAARDAKDEEERKAALERAKAAEDKAKETEERKKAAEAEAAQKAKDQEQAEAREQQAAQREEKATKQAEAARMTPEERKEAKAAKRNAKQAEAPKQAHRETAQAQNLLKTAAKATEATPKDWAQTVVDFLIEHPEPEDVLEHVLVLLGQAEVLSRKGVRACNAALMELRRKAAEANGHANGQLTAATN